MHTSYWNNNGKHQAIADRLATLVPAMGEVAKGNPKLERFRKASNCYYDLYNNGLCNRSKEFFHVFKFRSSDHRSFGKKNFSPSIFPAVEEAMDQIILDAGNEQGVF
jgi:hypothetical protein